VKLVLSIDGERREVEVDLDRNTVRLEDREYPIRIVATAADGVTVEIATEQIEVRGWPAADPAPPAHVTIQGEVHDLAIESVTGTVAGAPPAGPFRDQLPPGAAAVPVPPVGGGADCAILPPMPGKVLEVRVAEGDRVAVGQVLVVVEAMKMRNEITSPVAGSVTGLTARAGGNARAGEPLLRIRTE
jgi:biotin carboxyl carrier protein